MPTYRTYFDKDAGKYLGSYAPLDGDPHDNPGNPYCGHPSVEGQRFNAKDRMNVVTQEVEKGVVVLPVRLSEIDQLKARIAALEAK